MNLGQEAGPSKGRKWNMIKKLHSITQTWQSMSIAAIIYIRSGKWKVNVYPGAKCDEASHFLLLVVKSMDTSVFLKAYQQKITDAMRVKARIDGK